jgi:hypothetical protein
VTAFWNYLRGLPRPEQYGFLASLYIVPAALISDLTGSYPASQWGISDTLAFGLCAYFLVSTLTNFVRHK